MDSIEGWLLLLFEEDRDLELLHGDEISSCGPGVGYVLLDERSVTMTRIYLR